jgi:hypothetical protein
VVAALNNENPAAAWQHALMLAVELNLTPAARFLIALTLAF